jgi:hypothetical protein
MSEAKKNKQTKMPGPGGITVDEQTILFWEEWDQLDIHVRLEYDTKEQVYSVTVDHPDCCTLGDSWYREGFEPLFGIDQNDMFVGVDKATSLAEEIERRLDTGDTTWEVDGE